MKKLFSLAFILLGIFAIYGCSITAIDSNGQDIPDHYDGRITIRVNLTDGVVHKDIYYLDEDELTVFDMLLEHFDVTYIMHDYFGPMITGIDTLHTSFGSFISIIHNGEPSMVGAQDMIYQDGDIIIFERAWWDEDARRVRETLETMIKNQIENEGPIHHHFMVRIGLSHLDWAESADVYSYEEGDYTESQLAMMILVAKSQGLDPGAWYDELMLKKTIAWPYGTALTVMALTYAPFDVSDYFSDFVSDLQQRDLNTLDPDTLTMVSLALHILPDPIDQGLFNHINALIIDQLHVNTYGENSASYAHALMALVTMDNPLRSIYEDEQGQNLLELMLEFHDGNGAFYWNDNAVAPDLYFSTPQAFLALALLDTYLNRREPVHPFIFE